MRLEIPDGEIIFYGDVKIRSLQSIVPRNETPAIHRYWTRVAQDGQAANYGENIEITEEQYNQLKEMLDAQQIELEQRLAE